MESESTSNARAPAAGGSSAGVSKGAPDRARAEERADARRWGWFGSPGRILALALVSGVVFGFLLQKGGVGKFDILIGVLLLENFVVVQVMLAAIIAGMIGFHLLERAGVIERQISETTYGADLIGGLIFGVGFGLLAYCPGTAAAAVGQGNLDAIVGMLGLLLGSYLFALSSRFSSGKISSWGQRGKVTLPDLVGMSTGAFIAIFAPLLVAVLVVIELLAD